MDQSNKPKETAAFITSKDTLDGAYPALILGINARRLGMQKQGLLHLHGSERRPQRMDGKSQILSAGINGCNTRNVGPGHMDDEG